MFTLMHVLPVYTAAIPLSGDDRETVLEDLQEVIYTGERKKGFVNLSFINTAPHYHEISECWG